MTSPSPAGGGDAEPGAQWNRVEEQAKIQLQWVPATRVELRKQIVTEIQTIEVEIRREELIVTTEPVEGTDAAPFPVGQAPIAPDPLVYVLRTEVPTISLTIEPYERVVVATEIREDLSPVVVSLRSEQIRINKADSAAGIRELATQAIPAAPAEPAKDDEESR